VWKEAMERQAIIWNIAEELLERTTAGDPKKTTGEIP